MDQVLNCYSRFLRGLKLASLIFYGVLVIVQKVGPNSFTLPLYPYLSFACKWCLFLWLVVLGVQWGKLLMQSQISSMKQKINDQELIIEEKEKKLLLQKTTKLQLNKELTVSQDKIKALEESVKKLSYRQNRTAADANNDALKAFVGGGQ